MANCSEEELFRQLSTTLRLETSVQRGTRPTGTCARSPKLVGTLSEPLVRAWLPAFGPSVLRRVILNCAGSDDVPAGLNTHTICSWRFRMDGWPWHLRDSTQGFTTEHRLRCGWLAFWVGQMQGWGQHTVQPLTVSSCTLSL